VSFNSGGIEEFINYMGISDGCIGKVVDSNSLKEITEMMINVMADEINFNPELSVKSALEFDISVQFPKWEKIINTYI
jgi:hypothetical protein